MNAKGTRKVLNEAFKRFQQLPDWPVKLERIHSLQQEKKHSQKGGLSPLELSQAPSLAQVLAE